MYLFHDRDVLLIPVWSLSHARVLAFAAAVVSGAAFGVIIRQSDAGALMLLLVLSAASVGLLQQALP